MKFPLTSVALALALLALPAAAAEEHGGHGTATEAQSGALHAGHGKVVSVDAGAGTVRIAHEPIASLRWPKMTMNFQVAEGATLEGIAPGMAVDFELAKAGSGYRITKIAPAR